MTVKRKLGSQQGFSLAELLLAVLILLLVSTIVATGVPAARNAYYKVILASNAQSVLTTATTALRDEFSTAWDVQTVQTTHDGAVLYFNPDTDMTSRLTIGSDGIQIWEYYESADRMLYRGESDVDPGDYEHSLLSEAALDGMTLTCKEVKYDAGILTFSGLQVAKDEVTLGGPIDLPIRVISAGSETISQPLVQQTTGNS